MQKNINEYSINVVITFKVGREQFIISKTRSIVMKHLIGDGLAKITLSSELTDKNFGDGVSCMVSLTVTVDQSEQAIADACSTLRLIAGEEARAGMDQFREIHKELKSRK